MRQRLCRDRKSGGDCGRDQSSGCARACWIQCGCKRVCQSPRRPCGAEGRVSGMRFYTSPQREPDPHALPDAETFRMKYAHCVQCDGFMQDEDAAGMVYCENGHSAKPTDEAWFWWSCFPGCLPDSEPI